ncbi:DUF6397 family protein [Streptomyces sp. NPDC049040]|uniref:DUF6397 family protein n=1 Tax=Streptomyces sp. NPDC049040 TaxID=3365593 RepID=UPI0037228C5E
MTTRTAETGVAAGAGGAAGGSGASVARRATGRAGAVSPGRSRTLRVRGTDQGTPRTLTLNRAREELGLDHADFELALALGEITTVGGDAGRPRVPEREIARVREAGGGTGALLARLKLVNTTEGAELLGISRARLLRLTRAGHIRPVRWYVNRYRALVWLYLADELREFAAASPALLAGRLPAAVREAAEDGEDQRPRGWRSRRVAQLVRDAPGPWEEAAVWAALLGRGITDSALPDPSERARLRAIHAALPPGRPGPLADAALIARLTTADDPDEIALGLVALADALGRARDRDPAPRRSLRRLLRARRQVTDG